MPSLAYGDYAQRMKEPILLIRRALSSATPTEAGAATKGAAVLCAAALERYMNDVVVEQCRRLGVSSWGQLTEGHQRYLARQMGKLLYVASRAVRLDRGADIGKREKLRSAVQECNSAFIGPDSWRHYPEFGV